MDFGWAINALKAGQKITRKAWAGDPPIYLYLSKTETGNNTIMKSSGTKQDQEWVPLAETVLADDWQSYFEKAT